MRVLEIAFGFPTVLFTTLLLVSLGYWVLSLLLGFDSGGGVEADFDLDVGGSDAGVDSADGASTQGRLAGVMQSFDLHLLPLAMVISIVSFVGFAISSFATLALTSSGGSTSVIAGLLVVVAGLAGGTFAASKVAVLLAPVFVPEPHVRRADLIARLCTVRTGSVSETFGQAEATDSVMGSHLIQVRCPQPNPLRAGSAALIISVTADGEYTVSPDVEGLR